MYAVPVLKPLASSSLNCSELDSNSRVDRRDFIRTGSLAAGALAFGMPAIVRGQHLNSKLNVACVGVGGKGRSDTDACATENIVALCDVDKGSEAYATQTKKYPDAKLYTISGRCWTRWAAGSMR